MLYKRILQIWSQVDVITCFRNIHNFFEGTISICVFSLDNTKNKWEKKMKLKNKILEHSVEDWTCFKMWHAIEVQDSRTEDIKK